MSVYPSWRYHKKQEPKLVHSEEEDKELGKDWADSPAVFEAKPQKEEPKQAQKPEAKE